MPFVVNQTPTEKPEKTEPKPPKGEKPTPSPAPVTPAPSTAPSEPPSAVLEKVEYNGLWYAPALKKFVDPDTNLPISDHTFEYPTFTSLLHLPPLSPVEFPTEDTVDWILEVVKGLPNFWYAHKFPIRNSMFGVTATQWQIEATKRDGRNLVFSPGLAAVILMKHGEAALIQALDAEFPK